MWFYAIDVGKYPIEIAGGNHIVAVFALARTCYLGWCTAVGAIRRALIACGGQMLNAKISLDIRFKTAYYVQNLI